MAEVSSKSRTVDLLLCFFLGGLGAHRFYEGKIGTAVVQLILSILGVGFLWVFIDFILILVGKATDKEGNAITTW